MATLIEKHYTNKEGEAKKSNYQAEFTDPQRHPARKRISLRTKDERLAMRKLVMLEREYALGTFDPWTDTVRKEGMLVQEAVDRFIKAKKRQQLRPATIENYDAITDLFARSVAPDLHLRHIEERHIDAFLEGCDLNATSRRTYLRHLNVFFNWAAQEGLIDASPVPEAQQGRRRRKKTAPTFMTREQYAALLAATRAQEAAEPRRFANPTWLSDLIKVAVYTGLRRKELANLRWRDVDLRSRYLTVRSREGEETKSGHERRVYLAGDALAVLERLAEQGEHAADDRVLKAAKGGTLGKRIMSRRFRDMRIEAGLPEGLSLHSCRHTFASWAVMGGMDLYKLKEVLGHASIEQTMIYAHLQPEAQRDDMRRIFGDEDRDRKSLKDLKRENERLRQENAELTAKVERLQAQLAEYEEIA